VPLTSLRPPAPPLPPSEALLGGLYANTGRGGASAIWPLGMRVNLGPSSHDTAAPPTMPPMWPLQGTISSSSSSSSMDDSRGCVVQKIHSTGGRRCTACVTATADKQHTLLSYSPAASASAALLSLTHLQVHHVIQSAGISGNSRQMPHTHCLASPVIDALAGQAVGHVDG
jgi:hypothetical protein